MKDYADIPNTTGAFPYVEAVNSTTSTTLDGTPLLADSVNEFWGFSQAVLNFMDELPTGDTDVAGDSQLLKALRRAMGYAGEVFFWAGTDDPASVYGGLRILLLEGQCVLRADYDRLDAVTYVGDALNATAEAFYRCDNSDGSGRSTSGVYLKLPNAGGRYPRAIDNAGSALNPEALIAGSLQAPAVATHGHVLRDIVSGNTTASFTMVDTSGAGPEAYIRSTVGTGALRAYATYADMLGAVADLDNRPYTICAGSLAIRY